MIPTMIETPEVFETTKPCPNPLPLNSLTLRLWTSRSVGLPWEELGLPLWQGPTADGSRGSIHCDPTRIPFLCALNILEPFQGPVNELRVDITLKIFQK